MNLRRKIEPEAGPAALCRHRAGRGLPVRGQISMWRSLRLPAPPGHHPGGHRSRSASRPSWPAAGRPASSNATSSVAAPCAIRRFVVFLARTYNSMAGWDGIQPDVEQIEQISGQRVVVADARSARSSPTRIASLIGKPCGCQVAASHFRHHGRRERRRVALSRSGRRPERGRHRLPVGRQPLGLVRRADRRPGGRVW